MAIKDGQFFHINELGNDRTFRFVSGSIMEIKNPNYRYSKPVLNYSQDEVGKQFQSGLDKLKTANRVPDLIKNETGLFGTPERIGVTQHGLNMGGSKPIESVAGITFGTPGTQSGENFVHESGVSHSQTYTDAQGVVHNVQKGSDAEKALQQAGAQKGGDVQYNPDGSVVNNNQPQDTQNNQDQNQSNISQQDYQLKPGETPEQYTARIAALRGEAPATPTAPQAPVSTYTGPSVVDFLDSVGQASDFGSRATLAKQYGIQDYTGTADQNTQLLNQLRTKGGYQTQQTTATAGSSAPQGGNYTSTDTPAPVDIKSVFSDFGVDLGDLQDFMKNPVASFEDTYDKLYKNLGIADLKSEASKLLKQATDIDNELADKISDVNDDPWLTEGVRVSRIQKLQDRYDLKKAAVTNTLALYDKTIDSATDQARFLVKGLYDQYNADRNFTQDMIGFIYDRVDKANQAQADLAKSQSDATQQSFENDLALAKLKIDEYNATKSDSASGMFNAAQINATVNQIAGAFDNEPVVKNFNILNEGYQFAQSLSNRTTNPADDQALIYAFAKAMDPNSVVREGEYNTVQKYAQSWVNSYGKSVTQAIAGTGFLSQTARENIKKTIENRYNASLQNYQNVYNQYQARIEAAKSGQGNSLTDYSQYNSQYNTATPSNQNQIPFVGAQNDVAPGFLGAISSFLYGNY